MAAVVDRLRPSTAVFRFNNSAGKLAWRMGEQTLPDYLRAGLNIMSIGLNPSLRSVHAGFYFANPRNRFWSALNASGLVPAPLEASAAALEMMLEVYGIGFTDVVKRATAGGSELRASDYRRWAPVLHEKLLRYRPTIAWFHGKMAYGNFVKYSKHVSLAGPWGEQEHSIDGIRVFVTPNPSPANAAFSLEELIGWYRELARLSGCKSPDDVSDSQSS